MPYPKGVEAHEEELYGRQVTTVDVQTETAAEQLGRVVGSYITIQVPELLHTNIEISETGECLAAVLDRVLRPYYQGKLCICGIGNANVTADSLGPEVAYRLPLKFFSETGKKGNFRDVCSVAPGTEMSNNIETERIVSGVIRAIGADCVLLVDSSTTTDSARLFRTIQLSTAGGFRNHFTGEFGKWSDLGVPVISMVVPTAIPLSALSPDVEDNILLTAMKAHDIVTASSIVLAYAILRVCWPSLSKEECFFFAKSSRDPIPYSSIWLPGEKEGGSDDPAD